MTSTTSEKSRNLIKSYNSSSKALPSQTRAVIYKGKQQTPPCIIIILNFSTRVWQVELMQDTASEWKMNLPTPRNDPGRPRSRWILSRKLELWLIKRESQEKSCSNDGRREVKNPHELVGSAGSPELQRSNENIRIKWRDYDVCSIKARPPHTHILYPEGGGCLSFLCATY